MKLALTDDEKEYFESYKDALVDGKASDRDHRFSERLRNAFGISEERAKEIK